MARNTAKDSTMIVKSITIRRVGDYSWATGAPTDPTKPFQASIEVTGTHGKVELSLSPEMSRRVVEIIAEEVAAAGRATAQAMTADALTVSATAMVEAIK